MYPFQYAQSHFEDVDLCRALHQRGYRVRHLGDADIVHLIGRSGERDRTRLNLVWEFSRIHYVERHFHPFKRVIMKMWIAVGALVRLLHRPSVAGERQAAEAYWSVVRRLWRKTAEEERPQMARAAAGQ